MFCLGFYFDLNEFNGVFEVYLFLKRGSYLIWAELGFYCFGFAQSLISSLLFFFCEVLKSENRSRSGIWNRWRILRWRGKSVYCVCSPYRECRTVRWFHALLFNSTGVMVCFCETDCGNECVFTERPTLDNGHHPFQQSAFNFVIFYGKFFYFSNAMELAH